MAERDSLARRQPSIAAPLIWSVALVFACFFAYSLLLLYWVRSFENFKDGVAATGPFGDSFGPLTSLLTGLAFAVLIVSLIIQSAELRASLNELQHSVKAQEDTVRLFVIEKHREENRYSIELSQNFWHPSFYSIRRRAYLIIEYCFPRLSPRPRHDAEDRTGKLMDWMVLGDAEALSELNSYMEAQGERLGMVGTGGAPDWLTCFTMVLQWWSVYAAATQTTSLQFDPLGDAPKPHALPDYMGNQWDWWGPRLLRFVAIYREIRKEKMPELGEAIWEIWLPKYDGLDRLARPERPWALPLAGQAHDASGDAGRIGAVPPLE